jgi:type II secretory pathway pseudopilin PulG
MPARARPRRPLSAVRRGRSRGGYSLVILTMIVTTLSILAASALPAISQMIRRNKEEELIFRGFQYAEAIRVFQRRYSRYPVRLEELIEVKPRCIRQLWKDPMTDDGAWSLITARNGPAAPGGQAQPNDQQRRQPPGSPPEGGDQALQEQDPSQPRENVPILGVVSKNKHEAIKTLFGRSHYNEWRFTADVLQVSFGVGPGGRISRAANATWIGRPFRQGLAQPGTSPAGTGNAPLDPHPGLHLPGTPPAAPPQQQPPPNG